MAYFPRSLIEFQRRFPDERACAEYLARVALAGRFYHGLCRKHLQSYLDEFAFRFHRRHTRHAAFRSLLAIAVAKMPTTYNMLIKPEATG